MKKIKINYFKKNCLKIKKGLTELELKKIVSFFEKNNIKFYFTEKTYSNYKNGFDLICLSVNIVECKNNLFPYKAIFQDVLDLTKTNAKEKLNLGCLIRNIIKFEDFILEYE